MELPGSPSRRVLITGIPPATAASKARATPLSSARAARSAPWWARRALLAVTTDLPAWRAASTTALAAPPDPPISSTTQSTVSERASATGSSNQSIPVRSRAAVAAAVARRDRRDADVEARSGQRRPAAFDHPDHGRTDGAEPGDPEAKADCHDPFRARATLTVGAPDAAPFCKNSAPAARNGPSCRGRLIRPGRDAGSRSPRGRRARPRSADARARGFRSAAPRRWPDRRCARRARSGTARRSR